MESWNNILHTAIIGTDKKQIGEAEIDASLLEAFKQIDGNTTIDKEDKFLQLTALSTNFRKSGTIALTKEMNISVAADETKTYCNNEALQVLKDVLNEENYPLLKYWLDHANTAEEIVTPHLAPSLLSVAEHQKKLQTAIAIVCGNRGTWLSGFNSNWNFGELDSDESIWHTGTLEQRKTVLKKVRTENPELALEWLQQTWQQEDANQRLAFLEQFRDNISSIDISFLESLSSDKSKKVKEAAFEALLAIPESDIVKLFAKTLKDSITVDKNSLNITLHLTIANESIYKKGLDKLSSNKEVTDELYMFSQLIASVPPSFWENEFQLSKLEAVKLFQNSEHREIFIPAFASSIIRFKQKEQALVFVENSTHFFAGLIPLLDGEKKDKYCQRYFNAHKEQIMYYVGDFTEEWSLALANAIISHTANNVYTYNRAYYSSNIHLLPNKIVEFLGTIKPESQYYVDSWSNMVAHIEKVIDYKQKIKTSFKK